jgi:tRNA dimethylallyltransferase
MFKKGLIEEVKKLLKIKLSKTASQAIGIKEISGYLENRYGLEEAKKLMIKNTLKLIKKQLTWFKKDKLIQWINIKDNQKDEEIVELILEKISQ